MSSFSKYFISFTVFLLPFQTVQFLHEPIINGEKWQYGTIGIYVTDVLILVSLLLVWLHERNQKKLDSDISHPSLPKAHDPASAGLWLPSDRGAGKVRLSNTLIVLAFLWTGLSMLWASDVALAGYMAVKLLLAGGLFVLIRDMLRDGGRKWIVWTVIASALLQAIIGIGQFVTQETFSSTLFGISTHESWAAGTSVLKNESGRWLRAYGTLPHPNMYGLFLAVALLLATCELTKSPLLPLRIWITRESSRRTNLLSPQSRRLDSSPQRREQDKQPPPLGKGGIEGGVVSKVTSYISILLLLSIPILTLGLLLSFSRLAWLGFVFGFISLLVMKWRKWDESIKKRALALLIFLGVSGAVYAGILHETVLPRFDKTTIAHEKSITDRISTFAEGWSIFRKHPMIGVGAGNYTKNLIDNYPDRPVWDIQPAHSVPLIILAELGIVGLFLTFCLVVYSVKRFSNDLLISISLILLPSLLLDHFLWTSHFGILLFALILGLAYMKRDEVVSEQLRNCSRVTSLSRFRISAKALSQYPSPSKLKASGSFSKACSNSSIKRIFRSLTSDS